MRTCRKDFPGVDRQTSDRLALDVKTDEEMMVGALAELRRSASVSLEAIGYLLGSDPAQVSRYLKGSCSISFTNYLRIARALGYRCKIIFEKADNNLLNVDPLEELRITTHQVHHRR
jgi:transcriptional regulator with XRE-family HTH domain